LRRPNNQYLALKLLVFDSDDMRTQRFGQTAIPQALPGST